MRLRPALLVLGIGPATRAGPTRDPTARGPHSHARTACVAPVGRRVSGSAQVSYVTVTNPWQPRPSTKR